MTGSQTEREMPPAQAEDRARAAVERLGLYGETEELVRVGGLAVWRCRLRDRAGRAVPHGHGAGKGRCEDARAGALFEALEHHLTGPAHFAARRMTFRPGSALAAGPLAREACAPVLRVLPRVACRTYTPLHPGGGDRLEVPVALSTSWYQDCPGIRRRVNDTADYTRLSRYGSNSGSAIGVSRQEALVHALNEMIERDAVSLLLARAFLGPGARTFRPRVVDPATLPPQPAAALACAERVTAGPVHLLQATTDVGVPTYLAYSPGPQPLGELRCGSGTSLSARYAAWRALAELVQVRTLGARLPAERLPTLEAFARYPALRACATFDLSAHLARAETVPFPAGEESPGDVGAQLRRLSGLLAAAGHPPYYRVACALPCGITAVHVHAPGLERFMTVLSGVLLIPGPRARTHLRAAAEEDRR